ncbi:MAG: hypothetical protein HC769_12935 [Cyanobacteria bacterium CRU_2_1]|nr:hypothetical protein [Cyanobacteria bacterium CRU_2_1]
MGAIQLERWLSSVKGDEVQELSTSTDSPEFPQSLDLDEFEVLESDVRSIFPAIEGSGFQSDQSGIFEEGLFESGNEANQAIDKSRYSVAVPRQVGIVAGVAIAVTAGTLTHVVNQPPEYEGTFEITAQPRATGTDAVGSPQIEDPNQSTIEFKLDSETQVRILQSPRLVEVALKRLQAENPEIDYHAFVKNLRITVSDDRTLEVRYHDTDPEQVQMVLDQLAQTYVEYSQECRDEACRGLSFIRSQLPQIQNRVMSLRAEIRQFHQQHGLQNLERQVRMFSVRSTEIAKQSADVDGKLVEAQKQYHALQTRMTLQPNEPIAQTILDQDERYQALLEQFKQLDSQVINALSTYRADDPNVQSLYAQHQKLSAELYQESQRVLSRYTSNPNAILQDPIFQEPTYLNLLQQSIGTVHYMQILQIRQQSIAQAQQSLAQQRQELATILRQYSDLRQQLQAETKILQEYLDKKDVLSAQVIQHNVIWEINTSPELNTNANGKPIPNYFRNVERDLGSATILGVLLGMAIAYIMKEQNRSCYNSTLNMAQSPEISGDRTNPSLDHRLDQSRFTLS